MPVFRSIFLACVLYFAISFLPLQVYGADMPIEQHINDIAFGASNIESNETSASVEKVLPSKQYNHEKIFSDNIKVDLLTYNQENLAYLDFPLMEKIDKDMLDFITPENYSLFDMPSRDLAPIHKYNTSVGMNKSAFDENTDIVADTIFNYIFGILTKNSFTLNFNFQALIDNPDSVNMSIILTPLKNFILKYSRIENDLLKKSVFEMKLRQDANKLFTFKTSEDGKGSTTGFEFELKF